MEISAASHSSLRGGDAHLSGAHGLMSKDLVFSAEANFELYEAAVCPLLLKT